MSETASSEDVIGLLARLERSWDQDDPIPLERLIEEAQAPLSAWEIRDLVALEVRLRRLSSGRTPRPDDYLDRFPEVADEIRSLFRDDTEPPVDRSSSFEAELVEPRPESTEATVVSSGRFRIVRLHARGGLGRVYVAHDEGIGRDVALKEIRPDCADDPRYRNRFLLEAEINGGLEHPGIIPVYGAGTHPDGRPYYVMRFVGGRNLDEIIKDLHAADPRPDPGGGELRKLLSRFVTICQAIAYSHSRRVLHRDLKPANILLGGFGETFLIDWGLAKVLPDGAGAERSDADVRPLLPPSLGDQEATEGEVGTPAYMSPEQAGARQDLIGPATDIYGLGAILYKMLTGQAPARGNRFEVLARVAAGEIAPPRDLNAAIPKPLEAICSKAMAREAGDRYGSASELASDIEAWLADEPVTAYREPLVPRLARWGRRHRTWVRSVAAAFGLVLLVTLFALYQVARARDVAVAAQGRSTRNAAAARKSEARAVVQQRIADANAAAALKERAEAVAQRQAAEKAQAEAIEQQGIAEANEQRARDEAQRAEMALAEVARQKVVVQSKAAEIRLDTGVALSRLGDVRPGLVWMAESLNDVPAEDQELDRVARDQFAAWATTFYPCSEMWEVAGAPEWIVPSPDGELLAIVGYDPTRENVLRLRLWERATRRPIGPDVGGIGSIHAVAFSPDGKTLYTGGKDGFVRSWDPRSTEAKGEPFGHKVAVGRIEIDATGKRMLVIAKDTSRPNEGGGWETQIAVWDLSSRGSVADLMTRTSFGELENIASLSPGGTSLAIIGASGGGGGSARMALRLYSLDRDGVSRDIPLGESRSITVDPPSRFSPDGSMVAVSTGEEIRLYDVATGELEASYPKQRIPMWKMRFSPDGKLLAAIGSRPHDSELSVFSTERGEGLIDVARRGRGGLQWAEELDEWIVDLNFSPDGAGLACATRDTVIRLYDAADGDPLGQSIRRGIPMSTLFLPDGDHILTWSVAPGPGAGGILHFWGLPGNRANPPRITSSGPVQAISFTKAGDRYATATAGKVAFWDRITGGPEDDPMSYGKAAVFDAAGTRVAFIGTDPDEPRRMIYGICNLATEELEVAETIPELTSSPPILSPDLSRMAVRIEDDVVIVRDLIDGGRLVRRIEPPNELDQLAFSPDGSKLLAASAFDGDETRPDSAGNSQVWLWDLEDPARDWGPLKVPADSHATHGHPVLMHAFSADGRLLALAPSDGVLRLLDTREARVLWELPSAAGVLGVAIAAAGDRLAYADAAWQVHLVEVGTGTERGDALEMRDAGDPFPWFSLAFSPDGRMLAGGQGGVYFWDVASRRQLGPPLSNPSHGMRLSGGRRETGLKSVPLDSVAALEGIAFSPDGNRLAPATLINTGGTEIRYPGLAPKVYRMWNRPRQHPGHLRLWAEVLTAFSLEGHERPVELSDQEWQAKWRELQAAGGPPDLLAD